MSKNMMFSSFFKKNQPTAEQVEELNEANVALRVRMDKILYLSTVKQAGLAKPPVRIFEGRVAA
jgi:hypothetical protein